MQRLLLRRGPRLLRTSAPARRAASLSNDELRTLLAERGVDAADCADEAQLVQRLRRALQPGAALAASRARLAGEGERSLCELFERCAPSVAFIQISAVRQASPFEPASEVPSGSGSGFVWDDKGHIITNWHVVKDARRATVSFRASTLSFEASLVGSEVDKDIAVLRLRGDPAQLASLAPLAVGSSSPLLVGQSVAAIGNPFGLAGTLTTGIISALGRDLMGVGGRPIRGCVQTDAAINPGNSGGPLMNSLGEVIGVNTAIYSPSGGSAGIGFAIPIDTVKRIAGQLIQHGRTLRPTLGINVCDLGSVSGSMGGMAGLKGALVVEAPRGTPAHAAGINGCARSCRHSRSAQLPPSAALRRPFSPLPAPTARAGSSKRLPHGGVELGDLIVSANGTRTDSAEDLLAVVEAVPLNSRVELELLRRCDVRRRERVSVFAVDRTHLNAQ